MKELKAADHAFIFNEVSPKAPVKKLIEKHAEKVWETAETKTTAKQPFNVFAMTDALGERNRAKLWVLYQKALADNGVIEEIHGLLFWQVKTMLGAAQSKTAEEAGLKPFVWGKAQGFLRNYTLPELKKISSEMVNVYHGARLDSLSLEDSLEVFILSLSRK